MKPTIRTPYQGSLAQGEFNPYPSLTVPDQGMTVKDLLRRTQNGLSTSGIKVPMYDGETDPTGLDGRDYRTLDISEKHELLRQNAEHIADLKAKAQQNAKEIDEWKTLTQQQQLDRRKEKEAKDAKDNKSNNTVPGTDNPIGLDNQTPAK